MSACPTPEKHAWPSEKAAKRGLRSIRHPHGRMKVYRCGAHWHVGHGTQETGDVSILNTPKRRA